MKRNDSTLRGISAERNHTMNFSPKALFLALPLACLSYGQTGTATSPPVDKAAAYYNFSMGHLYAELAGVYGNRSEYVGKAIDHYKQALKLDPGASFLFEELTDLYIQSGRLKDAVTEAEDILKREPNNLDARRILGRKMFAHPSEEMFANLLDFY